MCIVAWCDYAIDLFFDYRLTFDCSGSPDSAREYAGECGVLPGILFSGTFVSQGYRTQSYTGYHGETACRRLCFPRESRSNGTLYC